MECPICLESRHLAKLQPCGHMVCARCIHKQLKHDARCALCRQTMTGSVPHLAEFIDGRGTKNIRVYKDADERVGFCIQAENDIVVVSQVTPQSLAAAIGIAVNQELLAVNGLPCYTNHCTRQILSECTCIDMWVQENKSMRG